jgi:hypothetical protein
MSELAGVGHLVSAIARDTSDAETPRASLKALRAWTPRLSGLAPRQLAQVTAVP